jgi:hypothetical protein
VPKPGGKEEVEREFDVRWRSGDEGDSGALLQAPSVDRRLCPVGELHSISVGALLTHESARWHTLVEVDGCDVNGVGGFIAA